MIQPAAEQLLNLADRAEKGLTPDEAQRLRDGLTHHCARAEKAEAERDAWAAKAEDRFQRVLKQSRLLQELKRDNFELRMDLISLLDGRLGEIGPSDIQPGSIRRAALDEHQEQP